MRARRPTGPRGRPAVARVAPAVTAAVRAACVHSACQPPSPRSCSCGIAASMRRHQSGRADRRGEGDRRGDRIPLVRHRRRTAAGFARLGGLADFGLREQREVARDLAAARRRPRRARRRAAAADRGGRATADPGTGKPEARGQQRSATRGPSSPSAASVPDAPPNCRTHARRRARHRERPRWRSSASSHPAAFSPKVIGVACCSQVRPAMTLSMCGAHGAAAEAGAIEMRQDQRARPAAAAAPARCR